MEKLTAIIRKEKKLKTIKFKKAQQYRQNLIDQKKRKQSKT